MTSYASQPFNPLGEQTVVLIRAQVSEHIHSNYQDDSAQPIDLSDDNSRIVYVESGVQPHWLVIVFRTGDIEANGPHLVLYDEVYDEFVVTHGLYEYRRAERQHGPSGDISLADALSEETYRQIRWDIEAQFNEEYLPAEMDYFEIHRNNTLLFFVPEAPEPYWLLEIFGTDSAETDAVAQIFFDSVSGEFLIDEVLHPLWEEDEYEEEEEVEEESHVEEEVQPAATTEYLQYQSEAYGQPGRLTRLLRWISDHL